jgi:RimJ/RimL family protein N-acetyltransferase
MEGLQRCAAHRGTANGAVPPGAVGASFDAAGAVPRRGPRLRPRRLDPAARAAVRDHLRGLSDADRYLRFSQVISDAGLADYVERIDFAGSVCLGTYDSDAQLIAFCQGFEYRCAGRKRWEVAFTTAPQWRRLGLARDMFAALGRLAQGAGIDRLDTHCICGNAAMRGLLRAVGATTVVEDGEVEGQWDVAANLPRLGPQAPHLGANGAGDD